MKNKYQPIVTTMGSIIHKEIGSGNNRVSYTPYREYIFDIVYDPVESVIIECVEPIREEILIKFKIDDR